LLASIGIHLISGAMRSNPLSALVNRLPLARLSADHRSAAGRGVTEPVATRDLTPRERDVPGRDGRHRPPDRRQAAHHGTDGAETRLGHSRPVQVTNRVAAAQWWTAATRCEGAANPVQSRPR
jgi:hypothetical protein